MVMARKSGSQPHGIPVPGPRDPRLNQRHLVLNNLHKTINYTLPELLFKSFLTTFVKLFLGSSIGL